jgi:hypothetical protein
MNWVSRSGRATLLAAAIFGFVSAAASADDAPAAGAAAADSVEGALKPYAAAPNTPAFPVDYYDGLRAFENGQRLLAVVLWLQAAALGDTRAMVRIAEAFSAGTDLPPSPIGTAYYYGVAFKEGATDQVEHARAARDALTAGQQADLDSAIAAYTPRKPVKPDGTNADSAFFAAVAAGDATAVKAMLDKDFVLASESDDRGWQPLMLAALAGSGDTIKALLDTGAPADDANEDGYTALHIAAFGGSRPAIDALIAGGAHAAITTTAGLSAMDIARAGKHDDLASYLAPLQQKDVAAIQGQLNTLGYDVGKPDGTLNDATRDQLAIFAHRLLLDPVRAPTAELINGLFEESSTDLWGYVVQYTKDGSKWTSYDFDFHGDDRDAVTAAAMKDCADTGGKSCKVSLIVPEGSCLSHVNHTSLWSRIFADEDAAAADAKNRCRAQGMKDCDDLATLCVGD